MSVYLISKVKKWWGSKEGGGKLQFPDIGRQLLDGTQPLFPGPWITHFCLCYQSFLSTLDLGKSSNQWNKWCPEESTFSFIKKFFIGVHLLYNVLSISGVQQSGSAICIQISLLFWISFLFRSSQSTEFPVLYSRFSLVIHIHIHSSLYVSILMFQIYPSLTPVSPLVTRNPFSTPMTLFLFFLPF